MSWMARPALWSLLVVLLVFGAACGEPSAGEAGAEGSPSEATEDAATESTTEAGTEPSGTAAAEGTGSACTDLEGSTITFVVPYDAGGGYDTYARLIAPALEEQIGATVVVEN